MNKRSFKHLLLLVVYRRLVFNMNNSGMRPTPKEKSRAPEEKGDQINPKHLARQYYVRNAESRNSKGKYENKNDGNVESEHTILTKDKRTKSLLSLEQNFQHITTDESGNNVVVTKKGKILEIVPREDICFDRSVNKLRPTLDKSSSSTNLKEAQFELYSSGFWDYDHKAYEEAELDQWLQQNEICLDQIMIEEKIKKKVNTKSDIELKKGRDNFERVNFWKNRCSTMTSPWPIENEKESGNSCIVLTDLIQKQTTNISRKILSSSLSAIAHLSPAENRGLLNNNQMRKIKLPLLPKEKVYNKSSDQLIVSRPELIKNLMQNFCLNEKIPPDIYTLKSACKFSRDYQEIVHSFNTLPYRIMRIQKVLNPYLLLQYTLRKQSSHFSEQLLYHGTLIENVDSICLDNFDWRMVSRHKYGYGVSFSSNPYYASHYCDKTGTEKVMFAARVLVGHKWTGDCDIEVPKWPFDTTTDKKDRVYVKYDDCSFYPEYVIYYTNK